MVALCETTSTRLPACAATMPKRAGNRPRGHGEAGLPAARREGERVRLPAPVLLRVEILDLRPQLPLPPAVGYLAKVRKRHDFLPVRRGDQPGRVEGAGQRGRVKGVDALLREAAAESARLVAARLRQRDIRLPVEAVLSARDGGSVADEEDAGRHGRPGRVRVAGLPEEPRRLRWLDHEVPPPAEDAGGRPEATGPPRRGAPEPVVAAARAARPSPSRAALARLARADAAMRSAIGTSSRSAGRFA